MVYFNVYIYIIVNIFNVQLLSYLFIVYFYEGVSIIKINLFNMKEKLERKKGKVKKKKNFPFNYTIKII